MIVKVIYGKCLAPTIRFCMCKTKDGFCTKEKDCKYKEEKKQSKQ